jgi:rhodanese-related sulfurtransferase
MKFVSPAELKSLLHDGSELALLDVREAGQFGESHLLFATPLPYSRLELDVRALVPRISARVVVCDDGRLGVAALAAQRLHQLGYTDVAVLDGGTSAWTKAGFGLFKGVNVPSKLFGELVEHEYHTPRVTVQELARMKEAGENFVLLDGRPLAEHHKMTIPGSTCCPNAELPYRVSSMVANPATKIIVNCAGRTRSILGAQTLINFGVPNPVFALENGTQGWYLADFKLEHGATLKYPERIAEAALPALQASARKMAARFKVRTIAAGEVAKWLAEPGRTTYLCDVRTPEEFKAGSLAGAVHAPGGQLIQATDQWVGVRNSRVVLIDGGENVRAPVVASWLTQLGCDAYVLEGGIRSPIAGHVPSPPALPALPLVPPAELKRDIEAGACVAFDLGYSLAYRKAHVPGSRWSTRARIAGDARGISKPIVLIADDAAVAGLAAKELAESVHKEGAKLLAGGIAAWTKAGYPVEATPDTPADADCVDHLFFVHDRHAGNKEAMRQYLKWETGLIAQLDEQDKKLFRVGDGRR